jgi:hypothetical protein
MELIGVRFGEWNNTKNSSCNDDDDFCPFDIQIHQVIVHGYYNRTSLTNQNDIALIKLLRPVDFNQYVKPICLPLDQSLWTKNYVNKTFDVVGRLFTELNNFLVFIRFGFSGWGKMINYDFTLAYVAYIINCFIYLDIAYL